jgi:hypothetical protein
MRDPRHTLFGGTRTVGACLAPQRERLQTGPPQMRDEL